MSNLSKLIILFYFQNKPMKRWVAEAFEPYFMNSEPKDIKYGVFNINEYKSEEIDTTSFCSKVKTNKQNK